MCETGERESERQDIDSLVAAAGAGDDAAISALLKEFDPVLRAYLRQRTGGRLRRFANLEDLRQEVHVSVLGGLERLRPKADAGDFKRLLFLHAGWVLGKFGRRARAFDGESVAGDTPEPADPAPSTGAVTRCDRDARLAEHLEILGEDNAAVLSGFLAGKSFKAIAADLGLSENAVRKRFLRASAQLAELIKEEELR